MSELVKAAQNGDMNTWSWSRGIADKIYARAFMMMRNEEEAIDCRET